MTLLNILHVHSTFDLGGKEARACRLMNAFGDTARHTILSATGAMGARRAIDPGVVVDFPSDHTPLVGKPAPGRYLRLARYMARFDLVLTYNWGAMDAVGARRLYAPVMRLPPLIHHEDGFNQDEAERQKPARIWYRRLMLPTASAVVVPSERLEGIAREVWRQPAGRVKRIANGIPVGRFAEVPEAGTIPDLRPYRPIVGTLAGLRPVKNLPALVDAFADAGARGQLVIIGSGPEHYAIANRASERGVADRVVLPGFLADPARYVGHFDIFALSSLSEQFPISLVEAMAAGKPVVATDVGDVRAMVAEENRLFIVKQGDRPALGAALAALMRDRGLRERLGAANRAKAVAVYDEGAMISAYHMLYWGIADAAKPSRFSTGTSL